MSQNPISQNAYGILGLLATSVQKDINKRIRDIDKYMKIGEIPQYDTDFGYFNTLRNKENIQDARKILSNPQMQIIHYFFALNKEGELINNLTFSCIRDYFYANKTSIGKKNVAILLYLLIFTNRAPKEQMNLIIELMMKSFKDALSKNNINNFIKLYTFENDAGLDKSIFDDLFKTLESHLVRALFEIIQHDDKILTLAMNNFKIDDFHNIPLIENILKGINKNIERIEEADEFSGIKNPLQSIKSSFNRLKSFNLYEHDDIKDIRNRAAEILRNKSVEINNKNNDAKGASLLIEVAVNICASEHKKKKYKDDKRQIKQILANQEASKIIDEIIDDIRDMSEYRMDSYAKELESKVADLDEENINNLARGIRNTAIDIFNKEVEALCGSSFRALNDKFADNSTTRRAMQHIQSNAWSLIIACNKSKKILQIALNLATDSDLRSQINADIRMANEQHTMFDKIANAQANTQSSGWGGWIVAIIIFIIICVIFG